MLSVLPFFSLEDTVVDIYRVVIRLSLMAAELENQIGFISDLRSDEFRDVLDDAMTEAERLRRLANELLRVAMEVNK